ncbi:hypothetical protein T4D_8732 [Trichinella pseudospiralis]|uniref:Uncharacterized protein n=1 Tax=Trichinella pseudospiralis TaxID=6337 RepID=A0A0V1FT89_TRIPS|nr:hypothetical protein T4D_8732 [Trichinella pseudospiralis]
MKVSKFTPYTKLEAIRQASLELDGHSGSNLFLSKPTTVAIGQQTGQIGKDKKVWSVEQQRVSLMPLWRQYPEKH